MYTDRMTMMMTMMMTMWTRFEDKLFEEALILFPDESNDRWEKIADKLPGKSAKEVKEHYETLVHDVLEIDSGRVEIPSYTDESAALQGWESANQISFGNERKKGTPWTEKEHKRFLYGLSKYGKGDWRSISRNVVVTRTPTQVASHAQKYFLRHNSGKKERKRSSIHDITTVDTNVVSIIPPVEQKWGVTTTTTTTNNPIQHTPGYPQLHPNNNQGSSHGYHQNFGYPTT